MWIVALGFDRRMDGLDGGRAGGLDRGRQWVVVRLKRERSKECYDESRRVVTVTVVTVAAAGDDGTARGTPGRQPAEIFTSGLRRILSWSYTTKAMAMLGMILT